VVQFGRNNQKTICPAKIDLLCNNFSRMKMNFDSDSKSVSGVAIRKGLQS